MKLALLTGVGLLGLSATPGLSAQTPRPLWPEVDAVFQGFTKPGSPGCSVAMAVRDSVIYRQGYGLAVIEWGIPNDAATVFELGSVSKQFTAFSILLLEREGKLSLRDDIRQWLPEIPRYGKPITISHLIHHTSGLRDYDPLLVYRGTRYHDVATNGDILDMMARQAGLNFPTGSQWQYSNTNYVLLAMIVERVTGQSFREFARTRIFEPLGMNSSRIRDDHTEIIPRLAKGYQRPSGTTVAVDVSDWEETGDGSVQSTADDLLKWMDNLRTGKLGGDLVRKMTETGRLDDGTPVTYAFGLTVDTWRGLKRVQHGGSWAGYRSHVVRFPEAELAVVTTCNDATADPTSLALDAAAVVLKDRIQPDAVATAHRGTALGPLAGIYWSEAAAQALFIRVDGAQLVVNRDGGPSGLALQETGDQTFKLGSDMVVTFSPGTGPAPSFAAQSGDLPAVRYGRVASPDTSAAVLRRYAGRFRSAELRNAQWTVAIKEGGLTLQSGVSTRSQPLRALVPDVFTSVMFDDPVVLQFVRSTSGVVTGVRVSGFALKGLAFAREP